MSKDRSSGAAIPESDTDTTCTTLTVDEAARPITLADNNHPDQFYTNRSSIPPPTILRGNFKLKSQYYTLVGHTPYYGLSHENPMDHLERFKDLISAIKVKGVLKTTSYASSSSTHLLEMLRIGLSSYHPDLSHPGATSRMHSYATSLMRPVLKT